jgi:hypothetical protein
LVRKERMVEIRTSKGSLLLLDISVTMGTWNLRTSRLRIGTILRISGVRDSRGNINIVSPLYA